MKNEFTKLSKGCQLCQKGKWLCIFITYKCTGGCSFCPAPFKDDRINSSFGNEKELILEYLINSDFEGISFSGGDPFLVFDRMRDWLIFFKRQLPDFYYWVYTNGLVANEDKFEILANEGLDEIRFNIAASDYLSPEIWEKIKIARKHFSYVTIEIPSIRNDQPKVIEALTRAEENGIDFLNLHDYILTEQELKTIREPVGDFLFNKSNILKYAISSIENTNEIADIVKSKGYSFQINHCSLQQKEVQIQQRRLRMGSFFIKPEYDIELDDGLICNYYEFPNWFKHSNIENVLFDSYSNYNRESFIVLKNEVASCLQKSAGKLVQVTYVPKMEVKGDKILLDWRVINS